MPSRNSGHGLLKDFPQGITENPWVLYHGTSSCYEAAIYERGLTPQSPAVTKDEVVSITLTYDELMWGGLSQGGYPVLKAYSLCADYGDSDAKPLFLGQSPASTLLYASRDFAAGETVRAASSSIGDLLCYLESADVREKHRERIEAELRDDPHSRYSNAHYGDLDWLSRRVDQLRPTFDRCQRLIASCAHGLIYAVQVNANEISAIENFHPGKGVRWRGGIGRSNIIAKVVVPFEYEPDHHAIEAQAQRTVPSYYGALHEWVEVTEDDSFRPRRSAAW